MNSHMQNLQFQVTSGNIDGFMAIKTYVATIVVRMVCETEGQRSTCRDTGARTLNNWLSHVPQHHLRHLQPLATPRLASHGDGHMEDVGQGQQCAIELRPLELDKMVVRADKPDKTWQRHRRCFLPAVGGSSNSTSKSAAVQ